LDAGIEAPGGQLITALSYNQDAQLSAVDAGSTTLASYTYNGFGQRVLKAFPGGTGEIYQYGQNGMLLEETDQAGTPQADYIYLNGRPIATLNPATGTLYYLQDDRLGTPQLATDSSQTVAWQAAYGPFGQASVSGSITQNLRFPGQYYDIETGWNHNGFRDYIPQLGRYAEPDPLAMQGSARFYVLSFWDLVNTRSLIFAESNKSPYPYVVNNPGNMVDPFGLCWIYSQSTGILTHVNAQGKVDYTALPVSTKRYTSGYSGYGVGMNNPSMQNVQGEHPAPAGPIPQDTYSIGQPFNSRHTGPFAMRLTPVDGINPFQRKDFAMHGDNGAHNHSASAGCIIEGPAVRHRVAASGDHCLKVIK
jgi:RHS repeat-associated protein